MQNGPIAGAVNLSVKRYLQLAGRYFAAMGVVLPAAQVQSTPPAALTLPVKVRVPPVIAVSLLVAVAVTVPCEAFTKLYTTPETY